MERPFDNIMLEAAEMVGISARMAEEEARSMESDPIVLKNLMDLAKSCKRLMLEAKQRGQRG